MAQIPKGRLVERPYKPIFVGTVSHLLFKYCKYSYPIRRIWEDSHGMTLQARLDSGAESFDGSGDSEVGGQESSFAWWGEVGGKWVKNDHITHSIHVW